MAKPQAPRIGQALTIGERKSSELGEPPPSPESRYFEAFGPRDGGDVRTISTFAADTIG